MKPAIFALCAVVSLCLLSVALISGVEAKPKRHNVVYVAGGVGALPKAPSHYVKATIIDEAELAKYQPAPKPVVPVLPITPVSVPAPVAVPAPEPVVFEAPVYNLNMTALAEKEERSQNQELQVAIKEAVEQTPGFVPPADPIEELHRPAIEANEPIEIPSVNSALESAIKDAVSNSTGFVPPADPIKELDRPAIEANEPIEIPSVNPALESAIKDAVSNSTGFVPPADPTKELDRPALDEPAEIPQVNTVPAPAADAAAVPAPAWIGAPSYITNPVLPPTPAPASAPILSPSYIKNPVLPPTQAPAADLAIAAAAIASSSASVSVSVNSTLAPRFISVDLDAETETETESEMEMEAASCGTKGSCMNKSKCNVKTHSILTGKCAGSAAIICCQPKSTTSSAAAPSSSGSLASRFVAAARTKLGKKYARGGAGPNTFDCSGLVNWAAAQVGGVRGIPRTADALSKFGKAVTSTSARQPGDLIFFGKPGKAVYHVGIYVGPNQMINAPHTGAVVRQENFSYWPDKLTTARRIF